ncbi:hypothetical protein GPAL_2927 [Glaciecola pallidula DSM 14239 = ACAM 615]|uniref:Uncharacterized protein n=1 Tax=Brumicola pallidula DSM 14239 = ACAM 615 TaxID=1121922 RepID=K6ZLM4_9ALTE|nr:hypothetical protein GPAL_2927 [Glaciecola pallidula DSM 14239 = ACAM 615]
MDSLLFNSMKKSAFNNMMNKDFDRISNICTRLNSLNINIEFIFC